MRTLYKFHSLWPVSPFTHISTQQSSQLQNNKMLTIPCGSYTNKNYEEKYENDTTMTIQQFSNMKTYLHLLIIREIRTILKYYSSPIRSAKFLNSDNIFY